MYLLPVEKASFCVQSQRVNVIRSHIAQQHQGVGRIKGHPVREVSSDMPILEVGNTLRTTPGYADSIHAPVAIIDAQEVSVFAIAGPRGVTHDFAHRQGRPLLRRDVEHLQEPWTSEMAAIYLPSGDHLGDDNLTDPGTGATWRFARSRMHNSPFPSTPCL